MNAEKPNRSHLSASPARMPFDHTRQNRKWLFVGFDWDDNEIYLGTNGSDDENQTAFFIGTREEANTEAEARGNEWEDRTGNLLAKIVFESHGVVGSK